MNEIWPGLCQFMIKLIEPHHMRILIFKVKLKNRNHNKCYYHTLCKINVDAILTKSYTKHSANDISHLYFNKQIQHSLVRKIM